MTILEFQRNNYQANIEKNQSQIKKYEELYDSLQRFQGVVSGSQESFSSVNSGKDRSLSGLVSGAPNCVTATTYRDGMEKVLNKVGVKCVSLTYSALLTSIRLKLADYKARILVCEAGISASQASIRQIDTQIAEEAVNSAQ